MGWKTCISHRDGCGGGTKLGRRSRGGRMIFMRKKEKALETPGHLMGGEVYIGGRERWAGAGGGQRDKVSGTKKEYEQEKEPTLLHI